MFSPHVLRDKVLPSEFKVKCSGPGVRFGVMIVGLRLHPSICVSGASWDVRVSCDGTHSCVGNGNMFCNDVSVVAGT